MVKGKKGKREKLRYGYTTGTCAAAGAAVAYRALKNPTGAAPKKGVAGIYPVRLPDGTTLKVPYEIVESNSDGVTVEVIKDGGDDPDVTHKMPVRVHVYYSDETPGEKDYVLVHAEGHVILTSGGGIGVAVRPGLDCELGKWAINKVPRRMIIDNLAEAGFGEVQENITVSVTAVNGEEIAERTLNRMVGVEGGLSILGTSGIVVPYSNAAYIKTIEVLVRSVAAGGGREVVFTTGIRTRKAAMRDLPHLDETAFIRIADFIYDSVVAAAENGIEVIHIACMPGKLYKYAQGIQNTHAHKSELSMDFMCELLGKLGAAANIISEIENCGTVSEAATHIEPGLFSRVLCELRRTALAELNSWAGDGSRVELHLYDSNGNELET